MSAAVKKYFMFSPFVSREAASSVVGEISQSDRMHFSDAWKDQRSDTNIRRFWYCGTGTLEAIF
jgi:hypothetical protein